MSELYLMNPITGTVATSTDWHTCFAKDIEDLKKELNDVSISWNDLVPVHQNEIGEWVITDEGA